MDGQPIKTIREILTDLVEGVVLVTRHVRFLRAQSLKEVKFIRCWFMSYMY